MSFSLGSSSAARAADSGSGAAAPRQDFPPISIVPGPYSDDLNSFKQYRYPDWFRDAKLGIWAHWGPQSVPMEGDWYARRMYEQGDKDYQDHLKRFGHPSKAGYKDIIPLWKAEKWDPDALMAFYKKAGARYFVAQAVHHDNFDNWNSKYHRWNSVNMGPHRDVVGDWQKAAQAQGLRFGVSEHLGASFTWFQDSHRSDKTGPLAGVPYDGTDPRFADLYHFPARPGDIAWYSSDPRWQIEWFARIKDLVDQYHPDLLYSDGGVPFENNVGRSLIAELYNTSTQRNGGLADAVYTCKQASNGMWVQDVERGVMAGINTYPWQTDTSIGDWFYNKHWKYRSAEWVIHSLVDIVSKNGNLLINVVQRPDGTLDDEAKKIVDDLAAWMSINGDGIYATRPWLVYGEGKSHSKGGAFNENAAYSADDIRFTSKGDTTLYAFALGWPSSPKLTIRSLASFPGVTAKISRITLLGHNGDLKWEDTRDGLTVQLPDTKPCDYAIALKIEADDIHGFKPELALPQQATIEPDSSGTLTLLADDAKLHGNLTTESHDNQSNIGYWDNPTDSATWKVAFNQPGKFKVTAACAGAEGDTAATIEVADQKVSGPISATGAWDHFKENEIGTIQVTKAGEQTVTVHPANLQTWRPINMRWIKFFRIAD